MQLVFLHSGEPSQYLAHCLVDDFVRCLEQVRAVGGQPDGIAAAVMIVAMALCKLAVF